VLWLSGSALQATRRATMCGSIAQPTLKESHPSFNPNGRAYIR
jgi:hypothetical protein